MQKISPLKHLFYLALVFFGGIVFDRAFLIDWEEKALNNVFCESDPPIKAEDMRFMFGK